MADQTAYQRICAEACEWCAKGVHRAGIGGQWHSPDGVTAANWPRCTAPDRDAVIDRLAGELERIKAEAAKLGCEPWCAGHNYAGKRCVRCGVEESHPQGLCDGYFDHKWDITSPKACNCAQSRIQVKP